jgi:hypothetical protein
MGKFICSSNQALSQMLEIQNSNPVLLTTHLKREFIDFRSSNESPLL